MENHQSTFKQIINQHGDKSVDWTLVDMENEDDLATESKVIDQDLLFSDRDDEEIALDFDGQSEEQEYD